MAIGKAELAGIIAEKAGLTQKQAQQFIGAFTETVADKLAAGDKVQLVGFGTFLTRKRESREGRNPATGEKITVPAGVVPAFKAGKKLKERLNG